MILADDLTVGESGPDAGCPRRTNNTAELSGVIQALLWLIYGPAADNGDTAVLLCDSCYAMDSAEGHITPQRNLAAIMVVQDLLARARTHRDVHFVHVKGHSVDGGNERADELAWWGKESGPYSRVSRAGRIQGHGAARAEPAYAARRAARLAGEAATHDATTAQGRKPKGAGRTSAVGLAAATDDEADQEALENEAFNDAMESAELDGLEGEEAELAAWERAAEALADRMDGNRQTMAGGGPGLDADLDRVDRTLMPPPAARMPTGTRLLGQRMDAAAAAAAGGRPNPTDVDEEEENRMGENRLDAQRYAVYDERSFLSRRRRAREVITLVQRPPRSAGQRCPDAGDVTQWQNH